MGWWTTQIGRPPDFTDAFIKNDPYYRPERIQAHVLLCGLGLLLIRIAETGSGQTWHRLRWEL